MAWITPNEGWDDNDAPTGSDLRRIEGNETALYDMITTEAGTRLTADQKEVTDRDAAILVETNARITADTAVLSGNASFYIENRSGSDPSSPAIGHMWIRIDI